MGYIGVEASIKQLLLYGNCYTWLLGAGWFVLVLFAIEIMHSLIIEVFKRNLGVYIICSSLLYLLGYYFVQNSNTLQIGFISVDLAFIGGFFYAIGVLFRQEQYFDKLQKNKLQVVIIAIANMCILYYFGKINPVTVDYPSRRFANPLLEVVVGLNGSVLLYIGSNVLNKSKILKKIFCYIGQNTLGIVFFHFLFFKVGFYILYLINIVEVEFISNFLPSEEIGMTYWWLIAGVSVVCSLVLWRILTGVKGIGILFGSEKEKWQSLYKKIVKVDDRKSLTKYTIDFNVLVWLSVITLICIPLINQGIMNNDELQYYFWSRQGFIAAYRRFREMWIVQGRFLASIFTPVWMWMSMLGETSTIFRIIPVATIILNVYLFYKLIYMLWENKNFAKFCFIAILAFLPVSFEPMAPNAYTTSFGIPFSFLLIAMIEFKKFIDFGKRKQAILMSACMLIAFSSYEVFVTYVPLFCAIALLKYGIKQIKLVIKYSMLPITVGIAYILLYVVCRVLMPSGYDGNSIGFTVRGALDILLYLSKTSFPGFFLQSPTYQYLNDIIDELQLIDYIRIVVLGVALIVVMYNLVIRDRDKAKLGFFWSNIGVVVVAYLYTILPALPISISSMYQQNVGENTGFKALPVSYFTYFAATFLCCFIFWKVFEKSSNTNILLILFVVIGIVGMPVQYMNSNFSIEQHNNFLRVKNIEKFLTISSIKNLDEGEIVSEDIFQTYHRLGIHDSYWQDTLNILGVNAIVTNGIMEDEIQQGQYKLSYDDEIFLLEGTDTIIVASEDTLTEVLVEFHSGELAKLSLEAPYNENGYYIYEINK